MRQRSLLRNGFIVLLAVALFAFAAAAPARAETFQSGDQICTGGNNLTLESGQTVGDVLAFGCNVDVQQGATVNGNVADFGGNVTIAGTVNGSIASFGGNVQLTDTAVVQGDVATMGGNYSRAPGATVNGNASSSLPVPPTPPTPPVPFNPVTRSLNFGFDLLGGIVTALAFAALGALVVIFAPNATRRVSDAVQTKPLETAGVGCLTLIVFPILAILLIITLIGIPIAFLLTIATWAAWIFGGIAVGLLTGEKILGAFRVQNILPVLAVMLGIVLLMLIGQIPILGWLVSCIVGLFGLGAVVMTRFGTRVYPPKPGMALAPVAAAPAASSTNMPATYTPSAVDVAAYEEKARQAQAREQAANAAATDKPANESAPPNASGESGADR